MWIILLLFLYLPFIIFIMIIDKENNDAKKQKIEEAKKKEIDDAERKFNQTYFEPYTTILKNHFKSIDFLIEDTKYLFKRFYKDVTKLDAWDDTLSESLLYHCMYWTNRRYCFLDHLNNEKEINKYSKKLDPYFKATHIYYSRRELNDEEEHLLFKIDKKRAGNVSDFYISDDSPEKFYHEICRFARLNRDISIQHIRTLYNRGHCRLAYRWQTPETTFYALKLYLHYLTVKSSSPTYRYSQHRVPFNNQAKGQAFNNICEQLKHDGDLDNAFAQLDVFMHTTFPEDPESEPSPPPRKKIKLNISSIQHAKIKQKEVAELLGEYLNDEDKENNTSNTGHFLHITSDDADTNQEDLFKLFRSNEFRLSIEKANEFAQSKGLFAESFIESINDQYYETLDDLLIEDDEDSYILNLEYLEQIMNK